MNGNSCVKWGGKPLNNEMASVMDQQHWNEKINGTDKININTMLLNDDDLNNSFLTTVFTSIRRKIHNQETVRVVIN